MSRQNMCVAGGCEGGEGQGVDGPAVGGRHPLRIHPLRPLHRHDHTAAYILRNSQFLVLRCDTIRYHTNPTYPPYPLTKTSATVERLWIFAR